MRILGITSITKIKAERGTLESVITNLSAKKNAQFSVTREGAGVDCQTSNDFFYIILFIDALREAAKTIFS